MPILENTKHELFAQAIAKGASQGAAYRQAGYEGVPNRKTPVRIANRADVKARVQELLTHVSMITKVDKAEIMSELKKTYDRATNTEDWSACNRSLELMGRELGMFVERHEVDVQVKRRLIIERLTPEDAAIMTKLVRKIEAPDAD